MPDTVTRVDRGAFLGAERLESLALPFDGVNESGEACAYNLNNLFCSNAFKNATVVSYAPTGGEEVSAHLLAGMPSTSVILNQTEIPESLKHLTITSCKKLIIPFYRSMKKSQKISHCEILTFPIPCCILKPNSHF